MYKSLNIKLKKELSFNEAFCEFQESNKARNLSDKTVQNYYHDANMIIQFMGGDFPLSAINLDMIIKYIEFFKKRGNKSVSINTRLRALRAMINHFADRGYIQKVKVTLLKVDRPIKETYTEFELITLLKKPNVRNCAFDDLRTWTIENFLIGTGCRLSSLINIKMDDLRLDENEVILRHMKGRQQIVIPIASSLKSVLTEYIQYRKPQSDNDYLFCTWHNEQLTSSGLISSVVRYNNRRGVTKTSIHAFRHTYAKMCIMSGMDAFRLMRLLGHKSIEMTQRYVNLFSADLKINYEEYNPLNKLCKSKKHIKLK